MKNLLIFLIIVSGNAFANSAVELSDGTFLQSSDYVAHPSRDKYSNNRHLRQLLGKLLKIRGKLVNKCEYGKKLNSSDLKELVNVNNDLLKIVNLRHPDGYPIVGNFNSKGTEKIVKDPRKNCGVKI